MARGRRRGKAGGRARQLCFLPPTGQPTCRQTGVYRHSLAEDGRRRIAAAYIDYMERVFAYYERQSVALFGREVRQVLLLHANALNADHFGALADMMTRRGYRFVPLDRMLADPAYDSDDRYTGSGGITWLHRWALAAGKRGAFFAGEPEVPEAIAKDAAAANVR